MVLSDREIKHRCTNVEPPMIFPFYEEQVRQRRPMDLLGRVFDPDEDCISYGLSSYGYDARCVDEYKVFTNVHGTVIDPKHFNDRSFVTKEGEGYCIIPPNSFALTRTVEEFHVPRDVLVICLGKSTYARCGIIINVTPLEPEWFGHVTLEISNTTPLPAKIYSNEGLCQFLFLKASEVCETSYGDRSGKYQGQRGITTAKL